MRVNNAVSAMGFRQPKSDAHRRQRVWADWIDQHRPALERLGLPPEVYLSDAHWEDFLENGYLEWHPRDSTGFEFGKLWATAAGALRRFLEEQYGGAELCPPLLGWLRVRHEQGRID
jgi:hypothetical protein